jgi:hypothetical protein
MADTEKIVSLCADTDLIARQMAEAKRLASQSEAEWKFRIANMRDGSDQTADRLGITPDELEASVKAIVKEREQKEREETRAETKAQAKAQAKRRLFWADARGPGGQTGSRHKALCRGV